MEITVGTGIDRVVILVYFLLVMGLELILVNIAKQRLITFLVGEDFPGG